MRLSGALILVVVLAMGVVVLLQGRDVERARDSVTVMATQLREEGVAAAAKSRDIGARSWDLMSTSVRDGCRVRANGSVATAAKARGGASSEVDRDATAAATSAILVP
jgi:hypothetical protein